MMISEPKVERSVATEVQSEFQKLVSILPLSLNIQTSTK